MTNVMFRATRIYQDSRILHANPPVNIQIIDQGNGFPICTASNEYGIIAGADTLAELETEIIEQLFCIWDSYALDDKSPMTKCATDLKELLLSQFTEESQ